MLHLANNQMFKFIQKEILEQAPLTSESLQINADLLYTKDLKPVRLSAL